MTREELRGIIEGISEEQLKKILDIHSSDIGKAKGNAEELKIQLETAEMRLAEREETVKQLLESQGEAEEMKNRIEELQKIIDRKEATAAAEKDREALENRFKAAVGDARFVNDFTRHGVLREFLEAVSDEKNLGRADEEIFKSIVGTREDLFAAENKLPSVVASTNGFGGQLEESDVREIMGLSPKM